MICHLWAVKIYSYIICKILVDIKVLKIVDKFFMRSQTLFYSNNDLKQMLTQTSFD